MRRPQHRVVGTRSGPLQMIVMPSKEFAGQIPKLMQAACHDGTPLITVKCRCGRKSHLHESQIDSAKGEGATIATRCNACQRLMLFEPGQLEKAFQQMRDEGWIE